MLTNNPGQNLSKFSQDSSTVTLSNGWVGGVAAEGRGAWGMVVGEGGNKFRGYSGGGQERGVSI